MIVEHTGEFPPNVPERLNPDKADIFWIAWDNKLREGETIVSSTWVVPPELAVSGESTDQPLVISSCEHFQHVNSVKIRSLGPEGKYLVSNDVTTDIVPEGRRLSFYLHVGLK